LVDRRNKKSLFLLKLVGFQYRPFDVRPYLKTLKKRRHLVSSKSKSQSEYKMILSGERRSYRKEKAHPKGSGLWLNMGAPGY